MAVPAFLTVLLKCQQQLHLHQNSVPLQNQFIDAPDLIVSASKRFTDIHDQSVTNTVQRTLLMGLQQWC